MPTPIASFVTGIHHVAFAESAGTEALEAFRSLLGLTVSHTEQGPGFTERMLPVGRRCHLQALEATGPGVVSRSLARRGPGLHHVALSVSDLDAVLASLRSKEVRLLDEVARPGAMGTMIAFVHPSAFGGVLVELVADEAPDG